MPLFNFIGCPQSGKTTIAALLFAGLKEVGMVAEFSPEQARFYIAQQRVIQGLRPEQKLVLTDSDQLNIMRAQVEVDEVLVKSCGPKVFIIGDSSPFNSMLYMSPEFRESVEVQELAHRAQNITTASFLAEMLDRPFELDPNRVHDESQSRKINELIPILLSKFPKLETCSVHGTTPQRVLLAQNLIFSK